MRIILDTDLRLPLDAKILSQTGRTVVMTASQDQDKIAALESAGAEVMNMPIGDDRRPALPPVLQWLGDQGVNDLLVEAGAKLAGQFVAQNLANQLIVYTAPVLMGSSARPLLELDIEQMARRHHISNTKLKRMGDDWRLIADF